MDNTVCILSVEEFGAECTPGITPLDVGGSTWLLTTPRKGKVIEARCAPIGEAVRRVSDYRHGVELGYAGLVAVLGKAAEIQAALDTIESGQPKVFAKPVTLSPGRVWAVCLAPAESGSEKSYATDSDGAAIVTCGPLAERSRRQSAYAAGLLLNHASYAALVGIARQIATDAAREAGLPLDAVKL